MFKRFPSIDQTNRFWSFQLRFWLWLWFWLRLFQFWKRCIRLLCYLCRCRSFCLGHWQLFWLHTGHSLLRRGFAPLLHLLSKGENGFGRMWRIPKSIWRWILIYLLAFFCYGGS